MNDILEWYVQRETARVAADTVVEDEASTGTEDKDEDEESRKMKQALRWARSCCSTPEQHAELRARPISPRGLVPFTPEQIEMRRRICAMVVRQACHFYEWFFQGTFVPARVLNIDERTGQITVATLVGTRLQVHEAHARDLCLVPTWQQHHTTAMTWAPRHAGVFNDPLGMLLLFV